MLPAVMLTGSRRYRHGRERDEGRGSDLIEKPASAADLAGQRRQAIEASATMATPAASGNAQGRAAAVRGPDPARTRCSGTCSGQAPNKIIAARSRDQPAHGREPSRGGDAQDRGGFPSRAGPTRDCGRPREPVTRHFRQHDTAIRTRSEASRKKSSGPSGQSGIARIGPADRAAPRNGCDHERTRIIVSWEWNVLGFLGSNLHGDQEHSGGVLRRCTGIRRIKPRPANGSQVRCASDRRCVAGVPTPFGDDVVTYLERHGIRAERLTREAGRKGITGAILDTCREVGAPPLHIDYKRFFEHLWASPHLAPNIGKTLDVGCGAALTPCFDSDIEARKQPLPVPACHLLDYCTPLPGFGTIDRNAVPSDLPGSSPLRISRPLPDSVCRPPVLRCSLSWRCLGKECP
jgi:hypothetical protein